MEADGAVEDVEVHGNVGGGRRDLPPLDDAALLLLLLRSHPFLSSFRRREGRTGPGNGAAASGRSEEVPRRTTESGRLSLLSHPPSLLLSLGPGGAMDFVNSEIWDRKDTKTNEKI